MSIVEEDRPVGIRPVVWVALAVSIGLNAVFIPAYMGSRQTITAPQSAARVGACVTNAATDLRSYAQTRQPHALNQAVMWLQWCFGIL